jgi:hypothetical protein
MGRLSTIDMIDQAGTGDTILGWHLECNHFPPLRNAVDFARLAIEAVQDGRGDEPIDTGPDVPVPRRADTAWEVIQDFHLEDFLEGSGDDEDPDF